MSIVAASRTARLVAMSDATPAARSDLPGFRPVPFELRDGRTCAIRAWREDDAAQLVSVMPKMTAESDFLAYMPGEFKMTVEQEVEFIRNHHAKPQSWSVLVELDDNIIAFASGESQDRKRYAHHAEFGLTVARDYWGQGLGRKLTELAIDWGRQIGLHKLYLRVFDHNLRAIKLYESTGFVEEARLKDDLLRGDGTYGDTIVMARYYT